MDALVRMSPETTPDSAQGQTALALILQLANTSREFPMIFPPGARHLIPDRPGGKKQNVSIATFQGKVTCRVEPCPGLLYGHRICLTGTGKDGKPRVDYLGIAPGVLFSTAAKFIEPWFEPVDALLRISKEAAPESAQGEMALRIIARLAEISQESPLVFQSGNRAILVGKPGGKDFRVALNTFQGEVRCTVEPCPGLPYGHRICLRGAGKDGKARVDYQGIGPGVVFSAEAKYIEPWFEPVDALVRMSQDTTPESAQGQIAMALIAKLARISQKSPLTLEGGGLAYFPGMPGGKSQEISLQTFRGPVACEVKPCPGLPYGHRICLTGTGKDGDPRVDYRGSVRGFYFPPGQNTSSLGLITWTLWFECRKTLRQRARKVNSPWLC